jgi:hypothetical protein
VELNWAILAEFKWKITAITPLRLRQEQMCKEGDDPRLISQFNLEITLTKHLNPHQSRGEVDQYKHFTADALTPKSFHVKLEEGNFPLPENLSWTGPSAKTPYTKRLVFDNSLYPPESEWKDPETRTSGIKQSSSTFTKNRKSLVLLIHRLGLKITWISKVGLSKGEPRKTLAQIMFYCPGTDIIEARA